MKRSMIQKNDEGKHYSSAHCAVCGNNFDWVEGENAIVEVEHVSLDGNKLFLDLKVTAMCPHCNYRCSYPFSVDGERYK